jgi:hypothetical protein
VVKHDSRFAAPAERQIHLFDGQVIAEGELNSLLAEAVTEIWHEGERRTLHLVSYCRTCISRRSNHVQFWQQLLAGDLAPDINRLANNLRAQRVSELESKALLHQVMNFMSSAVLAFDHQGALKLLNITAETTLQLKARTAHDRNIF